MNGTSYEAILFDFDGVLADTEPVHFACWRELMEPFGVALTWSYFTEHGVGIADQQMVRHACTYYGKPEAAEGLLALVPEKSRRFAGKIAAAPPIPNAISKLIHALAESGARLAVVTSSARSEVQPALQTAGILGSFEVLVCGEDVSEWKPSPEPYRTAARLLNVTSALVVEDSESGEASGRAAGFEVMRVRHPEELPQQLAHLVHFR